MILNDFLYVTIKPGINTISTALHLRHLTALTCLKGGLDIKIRSTDVLPVTIRLLEVLDCISCKPLLQLQHLESLSMTGSTTTGGESQLRNKLRFLEYITLGYSRRWTDSDLLTTCDTLEAAAATWSALPCLRRLVLDMPRVVPITAAVVNNIISIIALYKLDIWGSLTVQAECQLFDLLQHMTTIKSLQLELLDRGAVARTASGIAKWPNLRHLHLSLCEFAVGSIGCIAAATGLTYLSLDGPRLSDDELLCLLERMPALQDLKLSGNLLTRACVPAILKLAQLTRLELRDSSIQANALQCLTCLKCV